MLYGVDVSINAGNFFKINQETLCTLLLLITWLKAKNTTLLKSLRLVKSMPKKWLIFILDKDGIFFGIILKDFKVNTPLKMIIFKWQLIRLESLQDYHLDLFALISTLAKDKLKFWPDLLRLWASPFKFKMIFWTCKENNS